MNADKFKEYVEEGLSHEAASALMLMGGLSKEGCRVVIYRAMEKGFPVAPYNHSYLELQTINRECFYLLPHHVNELMQWSEGLGKDVNCFDVTKSIWQAVRQREEQEIGERIRKETEERKIAWENGAPVREAARKAENKRKNRELQERKKKDNFSRKMAEKEEAIRNEIANIQKEKDKQEADEKLRKRNSWLHVKINRSDEPDPYRKPVKIVREICLKEPRYRNSAKVRNYGFDSDLKDSINPYLGSFGARGSRDVNDPLPRDPDGF